ncbi:MAG: NAD(P)H-dependent oxidoreductase, partial [Acidobacteria bacterium]|nr:NAD(P)H-dependent oxidoreductase [Acidobacteriota bacterium]
MAGENRGIHVVVINGSMRPNNYTNMASAIVVDELQKDAGIRVTVVNPAEWHLPFPGTDGASDSTRKLQELVKSATAVVLVTPEYHGSF